MNTCTACGQALPTERVRLHKAVGRKLAARPDFRIAEVRISGRYPIVYGWPDGQDRNQWTRYQHPLHLGPDGEVEVLVEEPESAYDATRAAEQLVRDNLVDAARTWARQYRTQPENRLDARESRFRLDEAVQRLDRLDP